MKPIHHSTPAAGKRSPSRLAIVRLAHGSTPAISNSAARSGARSAAPSRSGGGVPPRPDHRGGAPATRPCADSFLPDLQVAVTIAHTFGWRMQSEVLALDRRHVDLAAGTLCLDAAMTKTDTPRVVYLTPELRTLLTEQIARVHALERH